MNTYKILKPKNLNLEQLTIKFKPNFKFDFDKAYLIIFLVIKFGNKETNSKKVGLCSKMLQSIIGRNYNLYIKYFLENYPATGNVLNGFRFSNGKTYSYQLKQYYFDSGLELYEIKDYRLINKFKNSLPKSRVNENVRREYYFLQKYFNPKKLTVFSPFEAINRTNDLSIDKRLINALNLVDFMNGEYKLSLKTITDGRVHSNITKLKKTSRSYLQYENEFLAEIDISSALPFFFYVIMSNYTNNNLTHLIQYTYNPIFVYILDEVTGDIDKYELDDFGKSILNGKIYEEFTALILSPKIYETVGINYKEVEKYYLYNFKQLFGYPFDGCLYDLKKFAKKRFLSMLLAPTNKYKYEQIIFGALFPSILKFVNEYKNVLQYKDCKNMKWSKKDSHKKLSHFLFQFEGKTMINKIAREYDKLHKGKVPVFTLHDCILTSSSNAEELKEFMQNKFIEQFGITPKLTLDYSEFDYQYKNVS